ncbi:MAG: hypothetical protein N2510_08295 [Ignavibacteria bacterium]|nr:hypothetical protein [Ignavibacteria bacterium]
MRLGYCIIAYIIWCNAFDLLSQKLEGSYLIGDLKAEIKVENGLYRIYWENRENPSRLRYNQNTVLNEQIWNEMFKGKMIGSFRFQHDYLSGVYVRQSDGKEFNIQKLE